MPFAIWGMAWSQPGFCCQEPGQSLLWHRWRLAVGSCAASSDLAHILTDDRGQRLDDAQIPYARSTCGFVDLRSVLAQRWRTSRIEKRPDCEELSGQEVFHQGWIEIASCMGTEAFGDLWPGGSRLAPSGYIPEVHEDQPAFC